MIFGIGTDITKISRFEKWIINDKMINRFFNKNEILINHNEKNTQYNLEHYASRFAAKEAFSKALGTGFVGLELSDFGIIKNKEGKPEFCFGSKTLEILEKRVGKNFKVHISISHEREYAIAFVIIENINDNY